MGPDRVGGPCPEPVTAEVIAAGIGHRMWAADGLAARAELADPTITAPLDPER